MKYQDNSSTPFGAGGSASDLTDYSGNYGEVGPRHSCISDEQVRGTRAALDRCITPQRPHTSAYISRSSGTQQRHKLTKPHSTYNQPTQLSIIIMSGLLGGVTGAVGNTTKGLTDTVGNTLQGTTNTVGQTTRGVTDTVGNTAQGLGNSQRQQQQYPQQQQPVQQQQQGGGGGLLGGIL
jgi:hypothetical protein